MSFQPKVYTLGHIMGMTGMVAMTTAYMYAGRHKHTDLVWFMENWGLYIGIFCTVLTFLFGLTILQTPWYDGETNEQLEKDHNRVMFEWRSKSPEEQAIINAARENELLQFTQIMQNNEIIRNQKNLTRKRQG